MKKSGKQNILTLVIIIAIIALMLIGISEIYSRKVKKNTDIANTNNIENKEENLEEKDDEKNPEENLPSEDDEITNPQEEEKEPEKEPEKEENNYVGDRKSVV